MFVKVIREKLPFLGHDVAYWLCGPWRWDVNWEIWSWWNVTWKKKKKKVNKNRNSDETKRRKDVEGSGTRRLRARRPTKLHSHLTWVQQVVNTFLFGEGRGEDKAWNEPGLAKWKRLYVPSFLNAAVFYMLRVRCWQLLWKKIKNDVVTRLLYFKSNDYIWGPPAVTQSGFTFSFNLNAHYAAIHVFFFFLTPMQ